MSVKKYLAEGIASFMVVFLAAAAIVADVYLTRTRLTDSFGPLGIVVAYGVAVAIAMAVIMPISGGHVNPAISIAAFVSRRLSTMDTVGYVVAQVAGAVVAGFLLRGLAPKTAFDFVSGGVPGLGQGISVLQGAGIEAALTFFLAFTFWAVAVDDRLTRALAPVAVGGVMVVAGLAGAAFTGAAMNPARWLGPALASMHGTNWLVWVPGPILGALLGSLVYEALFLDAPEADGELHDLDEDGDEDQDDLDEVVVVEEATAVPVAPATAVPVAPATAAEPPEPPQPPAAEG